MKGTIQVQIATAEGVGTDLSSVGCYISIDGRLYDVLTPLSNPGPDATVQLPAAGELRLIIKNMGGDDHVFGSVSVALELLKDAGKLWLPLFDHLDGDQLQTLPGEVTAPRVLVIVGSPNPLSPVPEMTERSSVDDLESFIAMKDSQPEEIRICSRKVSDLEHQLEKMTWKLKVEEDLHKQELESAKRHLDQQNEGWVLCNQRQIALVKDLTGQVGAMQKLFSQEKKQVEVLNERLVNVKDEYEAAQARFAKKEKLLNEELEEKEGEVLKLREENCHLITELRRVATDIEEKEEIHRLSQAEMDTSATAELQEALDLAVEQLADSEIQRKLLQDELLKSSLFTPSAVPETDELKVALLAEIETLHNQLRNVEIALSEYEEREGELGMETERRLQVETENDKLTSTASLLTQTVSNLTIENDHLKSELSEFLKQLRDAQTRYEDLHATCTLLKTERVKLANDFEEYRRRPPEGDVVDWLLTRYFMERGMQCPLQKIGEGLYSTNCRKFCMNVKNAGLVVRVGNGNLPLEEFFKIYLPMESKHLEQGRSQSVEATYRHRRVNTMPDPSLVTRPKPEDDFENSTNNTSQTEMKQVLEQDAENSMDASNRDAPARTPSPKRKPLHNTSVSHAKSLSKTPKTPNRSNAPLRKSVDKACKKIPFR